MDGDDDDDDSSNNDKEEEASEEEEEEEHLAPADSVVAPVVDHVPSSEEIEPFDTDESAATPPSPPAYHTTSRISILPEAHMPFPSEEEVDRALITTTLSPPHPSPPLPPLPLSLHLPPPVPTSSLPPLPASLYIRWGESSTATPRPTGGHGIDYGFIGTLDAETRHQRAEEVGYGIRDVWVDPTEAVEEGRPDDLEGVTCIVDELAAVGEGHTRWLWFEEAWAHLSVGLSSKFTKNADIGLYPDAGLPYRLTGVTDDNIDYTCFITTGTVISSIGTDSGTSG
ncbi:hypothetical protein Tco_1243584 [Tanacetum coccineum]|uniref:Uncharacterized protein n=1 Tax=Tanacetum coccineum TaxID=301880 RepID=A0ABQ4ZTM0_9ASTR